MSNRAEHHVVPSSDGGWDVLKGGSAGVLGHFATKEQAVEFAREVSRNERTELVIHNRDGRIGSSDSHGNDPERSRG